MNVPPIPRFLSGLLLFMGGYAVFLVGSAGAQFVLSPDVTNTLTVHGTRWLQPAYVLLIATGYGVGLIWGAYRMAVPGAHYLVAKVQRWMGFGSRAHRRENFEAESSTGYSPT